MEPAIKPSCPVCASTNLEKFLEVSEVPALCNCLHTTRQEALQVPKGKLALAYCPQCGHIHNGANDPHMFEYNQTYENALHHSKQFSHYVLTLARGLIERHHLQEKQILEIACGDGYFLRLLCSLGHNVGYGYDPGLPDTLPSDPPGVTYFREYYDENAEDHDIDMVCCRQALEHIPRPVDFLSLLRRKLTANKPTALFFEVPNARFTIRDLGIWDLIYEHPSYFTAESLARAFQLAGFAVKRIRESFGGQYLCLEATTDGTMAPPPPPPKKLSKAITAFADTRERMVRHWQEFLDEHGSKKIVLWGAGSKGITFLNTLGVDQQIDCVVDINPRKHGSFVTGTGQPVIAPEQLKEIQPDIVLAPNPLYLREIRQRLQALELSPRIIPIQPKSATA
jgi:hypothetical protein